MLGDGGAEEVHVVMGAHSIGIGEVSIVTRDWDGLDVEGDGRSCELRAVGD